MRSATCEVLPPVPVLVLLLVIVIVLLLVIVIEQVQDKGLQPLVRRASVRDLLRRVAATAAALLTPALNQRNVPCRGDAL